MHAAPDVGQAWMCPAPPFVVPAMTAKPSGGCEAASQCATMRAEESALG